MSLEGVAPCCRKRQSGATAATLQVKAETGKAPVLAH